MKQIGVLGWYNHSNIGDESYKISFPKIFPTYNFVFLEKPISAIDTYVLGGGDVVSESNLSLLSHINNKSIFSATVSKQVFLDDYKYIAVRDLLSIQNIKSNTSNVSYVPDFAFKLDYNKDHGIDKIKKYFTGKDLYEDIIVVVVNNYLMPRHDSLNAKNVEFEWFSTCLAKAIDNLPVSCLLLPFCCSDPYDDRISNAIILSKCKFFQKVASVYEKLTVQDTIDIISASSAIVSTRLHSSIFATSVGVPFLDIVHNHKNDAYLNTINMKKLSINISDVNVSSIHNFIINVLKNKKAISKELLEISFKQRQLIDNYSSLVKL